MSDVVLEVKRAKEASISMAVLPTSVKNAALEAMASALDSRRAEILEANARDLEAASAMLDCGEISQSIFKRLKIDDSKIDGMIAGIRDVIGLGDPAGEVMSALDLDDGLTLYQIRCPIGMLGVIFESRPDVAKVSIVGAGMMTNPGGAAKMFEALYNEDININMISTSEIRVTVLVDLKDADRAANAVHEAFGLSD